MEIITSWMEEGIAIGEERGIAIGEYELVVRLLHKKFGHLDAQLLERIKALGRQALEDLAETLLDFRSADDLVSWLRAHAK